MASSDSWFFMVITRNFSSALEFKPRSKVLQTTLDLNAGMSNNILMVLVLVAYFVVTWLLPVKITRYCIPVLCTSLCTSMVYNPYEVKCDWASEYVLNLKRMSYNSPYHTLVVSYLVTSFFHDEVGAYYVQTGIFNILLKFYSKTYRWYRFDLTTVSLHVDMLYKMICSISSTCTCIIFLIPTITVSESNGLNVSELFAYRLKQAMVIFFIIANGRIIFTHCNVFTYSSCFFKDGGLYKTIRQMLKQNVEKNQ